MDLTSAKSVVLRNTFRLDIYRIFQKLSSGFPTYNGNIKTEQRYFSVNRALFSHKIIFKKSFLKLSVKLQFNTFQSFSVNCARDNNSQYQKKQERSSNRKRCNGEIRDIFSTTYKNNPMSLSCILKRKRRKHMHKSYCAIIHSTCNVILT